MIYSNKFDKNKYKIVALFLNISLVGNFISGLFTLVLKHEILSRTKLQFFILVIPILYFLYWILFVKKSITKSTCLVLGWWLLIVFSSFLIFHPPGYLMTQTIVEGLSHIVLPVFLITELNDLDKLLLAFKPYIFLGFLYCILQYILPSSSGAYYYGFTYSTLAPGIIALNLAFFASKKYIFFFLVYFVSNLLFGGRAAILCYFIAFLLIIFLSHTKNRTIMLLLISSTLLIVFLLYEKIINIVVYLIPNTRFSKFFTGEYQDNSRSIIWMTLLQDVLDHPLYIRGILSDRLAIAKLFNVADESLVSGWYSHNFIIEILYEFGIWGCFFLVFFFIKIGKTIKLVYSRGKTSDIIFLITYLAYFFGKLSVSSSYLIDLSTGAFLGFLIILSKKRQTDSECQNPTY